MGILLLNSDQEIRSILQERKTEVVTLLVPEATLLALNERMRKNIGKQIPILLTYYSKYLSTTKRLGKNARKTTYQPSPGREKMKRINVRLSTGSWALLSALAQVHGVSRCYLFNYLLWLENVGVGNSITKNQTKQKDKYESSKRLILSDSILPQSP
ncbi:DUF1564 domain-containing protein [Leptospira barantonii]|uniref:DUF1564 domain-containing protein n=1 Tax=Leptospira barantonii TaxID=2023184 RepID=A0A5F2BUJ9_9LEPT|nr:DUF1564 domain-containing protein [Leptospira barantonii]TGM09848.1 DUF1564 domain-containing protein [Leptospira barantonii]